MTTSKITILTAILALALEACSQGEAFEGGTEERIQPGYGDFEALDPIAEGNRRVFVGQYVFTVKSRRRGRELCAGSAEIIGFSTTSSKITGSAECSAPILRFSGNKNINIGEFFNNKTVMVPRLDLENQGLDGRVTRIRSMDHINFEPHRPDMIVPIIQDAKSYANIDVNEEVKVTFHPTEDKNETEEGTGRIHVKVLDVGISFKPPHYPKTFDDVIHYHVNASGFEDLKRRSEAALYPVMEYHWNVKPVTPPLRIHIEGGIRDFDNTALAPIGDAILEGLTIDLELQSYERIIE